MPSEYNGLLNEPTHITLANRTWLNLLMTELLVPFSYRSFHSPEKVGTYSERSVPFTLHRVAKNPIVLLV